MSREENGAGAKTALRLDPRLERVAAMVRPGGRLADVGTDHGYLICRLAADGVITGGLALDVNEKPLARAAKTIAAAGLAGRIECRLSDGLSAVGEREADEIVIAGMGGDVIAGILSRCRWQTLNEKHFVLQPMTRAPFLRKWLWENGFSIEDERAAKAGGHLYTVMSASYDGMNRRCSAFEQYAGGLPGDPSEEAGEYLRWTAGGLLKKAGGICAKKPAEAQAVRQLAERLLQAARRF